MQNGGLSIHVGHFLVVYIRQSSFASFCRLPSLTACLDQDHLVSVIVTKWESWHHDQPERLPVEQLQAPPEICLAKRGKFMNDVGQLGGGGYPFL